MAPAGATDWRHAVGGVEQGEFHRTEPDLRFVHRLARPTREASLRKYFSPRLDASVVALPVPRVIQISKLAGIGALVHRTPPGAAVSTLHADVLGCIHDERGRSGAAVGDDRQPEVSLSRL